MTKFSIIVPVYNVEKYLDECLTSISNIEYDNFEVIVINDGSTDNSCEVVRKFIEGRKNFRLINQENHGLGYTRNVGVDVASGEYVIFIDSDDYFISSSMLKQLDKVIKEKNADVIFYKYVTYDNNNNGFVQKMYEKLERKKEYEMSYLVRQQVYGVSACTKCIKLSYIKNNKIYFNPGFSEDVDWSYRLLLFSDNIKFVNDYFYAYRLNRTGSITNVVGEKFFLDWMNVYNRCVGYKSRYYHCAQNKKTADIYMSIIYTNLTIGMAKSDNGGDYLKFLKENKKILSFSSDSRGKLLKILFNTIGIKFSLKLIHFFMRIRGRLS